MWFFIHTNADKIFILQISYFYVVFRIWIADRNLRMAVVRPRDMLCHTHDARLISMAPPGDFFKRYTICNCLAPNHLLAWSSYSGRSENRATLRGEELQMYTRPIVLYGFFATSGRGIYGLLLEFHEFCRRYWFAGF